MATSDRLTPRQWQIVNVFVTAGSALGCALLMPARLPGTEVLSVTPHWLLIWVVAWSVKRTASQGAIAGAILGTILDGMTAPYPSHAIGLSLVGALTGQLQKERFIQEDLISVALIVFGMAALAETVVAVQYSLRDFHRLPEIWAAHQRIAIASALLSSLWAPAVYYPLSRWWEHIRESNESP
ncbi:rod shape-determining protein MreD [Rubidibacter lacunae KORDI 51-2]|uniref:Rod shape-determining protein MreD n=1 Tax=Rubidibacter lacunae KORDI 51-2 TaxID=582515 RepID=U5DRI8_9CHRO|nr:rod shape-determining protein MreD [Rubidibacter lacunae]ERN42310.1 rod shape-determining protein MreD [Rubidibacter lacunae KORDI 51-2]